MFSLLVKMVLPVGLGHCGTPGRSILLFNTPLRLACQAGGPEGLSSLALKPVPSPANREWCLRLFDASRLHRLTNTKLIALQHVGLLETFEMRKTHLTLISLTINHYRADCR